ncbi:hypothetical protein PHO31112_00361 [Pandoraea horticolens]|uniref:Uncharacterized protein n=2 Tax=Pandoraea horticolens TaxID=2508298 RepID=A0A5E4RSK0_9BURK|nr:hypothetical protein PHO31112_00361 [Pandoraea horticolens]
MILAASAKGFPGRIFSTARRIPCDFFPGVSSVAPPNPHREVLHMTQPAGRVDLSKRAVRASIVHCRGCIAFSGKPGEGPDGVATFTYLLA